MEVLSPQSHSIEDYSSLDESWDSRLPTPLALDFSLLRGEADSIPNTQRSLSDMDEQELYVGSSGNEDFTATPFALNGPMATNGITENDTEYLRMAKKGGGHADLLKVKPHTPTPEPVRYEKKDGQWYTHDGVDVKDTQQKKEMLTLSRDHLSSSANSSVDSKTDTEYLQLAKQGGGHKDLLTVVPHTPTPEPVKYAKKDGQWYTQDGVDVKETLQRKDLSLALNGLLANGDDAQPAAGGKHTDYLDLAKKGGGRKDLLTVQAHTPSPEPKQYEKKQWDWYNQDDMVIKDGPEDSGSAQKRRRTLSDSAAECKAETEYLQTARKGGGHKDLLTMEPHLSSPEPVNYEKTDGQWYTHDGVDVKETQERKEMVTLPKSPHPSSTASSVDLETDTDYLKTARKGGGHKDLLTVEPHTPTPEPVRYDKTDGQWYTHNGVDVKETQQRKDLSSSLNNSQDCDVLAAGENCGEYLQLAKKGGGHKDLLTIDPHTPTPEPAMYEKTDGQWYSHDGVDVKDSQQRKEMLTVTSSPRPVNFDSSLEVDSQTDYLKIAKKGGGHKDLLTVEPHAPTPEPLSYDKKDGQWYTHDGVDVKETQKRKELAVSVEAQQGTETLVSAGGNNTEYLDLAKKGGGHNDLLTISPHTPSSEPIRYDKKDGQWYTHDGVDVKETQQRLDSIVSLDDQKNSECVVAAGCNNREYLELAKKGGGHQDLLLVQPHMPTPEPVIYDKKDGQWYTHDGVDIKESQQRRDLSVTLESIPEDTSAAGEHNGDYLETARQGGRKDLLTVEPHTPTPEPVRYDKKDGQWYAHDGVDVKDTQQRKEMVTVASSPRSTNLDSSLEVDTETDYLKIAKKGGGHKDLLTVEPHTPTPEPVRYDKTDGEWYNHDGVDVKDTQQRKEMVTVSSSPRPSSRSSSEQIPTETDYLKIAKKGGGHKDLLTLEPHTPTPEPVRYDKKDGQWYAHDGVDVKETQKRKEMVTVSKNPYPSDLEGSTNTQKETDYLKMAKKGGGHKDLLTIEPHTPSPEPQRYQKNGGDWYSQNNKDTTRATVSPPSPSENNNNVTSDYLMLARKSGGHSDATRSPRKNTGNSNVYNNTNTEYLKMARKGGGHKDLLTMEAHTPSPKPQRYQKKGGDWYNQDYIDGSKTRGKKGTQHQNGNSPKEISTETEYLKKARKGGGHKGLLATEHHKPSPTPTNSESKLGDWYYHDGINGKESLQKKESPAYSPRKSNVETSSASSEYLKMARKGGGHKDLLMMTPHQASPKPKEAKKQNTDTTPVNSPRTVSSSNRESTEYLRLARKGGGHPDPNTSLRRSASMRHRGPVSDYLGVARKGGHHKDLLTMPETSNFRRDQESRRSLRSFRSPVTSQVDGSPRPRTAEPRPPAWMGGSGPERVGTPVKRTLIAPFAYHEGSLGAARNPDKI
ncbi:uncharacterized protein LOC111332557 isoform X3 [Stylophora pistillata]|uniref:uncharacterized protein LOC111332557 isoform X3 n=1 Tax=Stylophora pistillata TaxID=50429 RepID=UPI000C03FF96|nr:uncharacterized protein LOC111332557 isoform X3 [Stylophora pistillata]